RVKCSWKSARSCITTPRDICDRHGHRRHPRLTRPVLGRACDPGALDSSGSWPRPLPQRRGRSDVVHRPVDGVPRGESASRRGHRARRSNAHRALPLRVSAQRHHAGCLLGRPGGDRPGPSAPWPCRRRRAPRAVTRPTVVVVTGADAAYAIPLAVMLRSLVDALSPRYGIDAYVIDGGLGDVLRARVEQSLPRGRANLHWHVPDARYFGELPLWGRMTTATYFKLVMPSVLPPAVTRALWLDADVLAAGDVAALWHADVERFPVRAVPDSVV